MLKKKEVLLNELNELKGNISNLYVGNMGDMKNEYYNTDNLYVTHLVHLIDGSYSAGYKKSDFMYVVEKKEYADLVVYKELFSSAVLERIDLEKVLKTRGMYIMEPISYQEFVKLHRNDFFETEKKNNLSRVRSFK